MSNPISIAEAAKIAKCSRKTMYILAQTKGFPGKKRGGKWYIDEEKLVQWLVS